MQGSFQTQTVLKQRILYFVVVLLVIAGAVVALQRMPVAHAAPEDAFTTQTYTEPGTGLSLTYYLYVPRNYDPTQKYPLVLLLHGAGERGSSSATPEQNRALLLGQNYVKVWSPDYSSDYNPNIQQNWPCFVVVPQVMDGNQWVNVPWSDGSYTQPDQPSDSLRMAKEIVDGLQQQYSVIDSHRLLITGLSMGGYGTWDAIERWPNYFAAAAPIAGAGDPSKAGVIANLPIWAFHGDADGVVPVQGSRDMIAALQAAGGHPLYTEFAGAGHDVWDTVYSTLSTPSPVPGFFPWFFSSGTILPGTPTPTPTNTATPTATSTPTASLPAPWQQQDIGAVGNAGSAAYSNGTYTVSGSGDDIWNNADAFHYAYQPLNGDGTIVARVVSQQNTDGWAKAGVMIRETLAAGSTHAFMALTPSNGAAFQNRTTTDGSSNNTNTGSTTTPYWVKLVRAGTSFTGSISSDGTNWTQVGSQSIAMANNVYVGLAVTAHTTGAVSTATFDTVSVSGGPSSTPTPTPTVTPTPTSTPTSGTLVTAINAGGSASGNFVADNDFDQGNQYADSSSSIDTSGVSNPAPQEVYQSCRWNSAFTYTIPGLTAGKSYTVRLHWAELTFNNAGQRIFNVAINGSAVLSNFDVVATAGAMKRAVVKTFTVTANSSGQVVIAFTQGTADNPFINGIEVLTM